MIGRNAHIGSPRLGDLGEEVVQKARADVMPGMNESATSMALCARLDLNLVGTVYVGESVVGHALPTIIRLRHFYMLATGSMASFAGNGHLGIRSAELSCFWIISFAKVGGVAVCAHVVPVLHGTSPKERVVGLDMLVGINVVPSFPFYVPASGQDLHPTIGKLYKVLLQRFPTKSVLHLKNFHFPALVFRLYHILVTLPEKPRNDTVTLEGSVVEIATDGFRRWQLHGMEVMRTLPFLVLLRMTLNASRNTDVLVETKISDRINSLALGNWARIIAAGDKQP